MKRRITNYKKEKQVIKGKNIRFSDAAHERLSAYCKKQGYNLGAFCEMGAIQRMENDVSIS